MTNDTRLAVFGGSAPSQPRGENQQPEAHADRKTTVKAQNEIVAVCLEAQSESSVSYSMEYAMVVRRANRDGKLAIVALILTSLLVEPLTRSSITRNLGGTGLDLDALVVYNRSVGHVGAVVAAATAVNLCTAVADLVQEMTFSVFEALGIKSRSRLARVGRRAVATSVAAVVQLPLYTTGVAAMARSRQGGFHMGEAVRWLVGRPDTVVQGGARAVQLAPYASRIGGLVALSLGFRLGRNAILYMLRVSNAAAAAGSEADALGQRSLWSDILVHAVSTSVAAVATFPIGAVVNRLVVQGHGITAGDGAGYTGALHCATSIYRSHGLAGFFRGVSTMICAVAVEATLLYATAVVARRTAAPIPPSLKGAGGPK